MDRKFHGDAARLTDTLADSLGQHQMMTVAGAEVGARLGDADDRLVGLQLAPRQSIVEVPLQIEGGHVGVVGIVEPGPATKGLSGCHPVTHEPGRKTVTWRHVMTIETSPVLPLHDKRAARVDLSLLKVIVASENALGSLSSQSVVAHAWVRAPVSSEIMPAVS